MSIWVEALKLDLDCQGLVIVKKEDIENYAELRKQHLITEKAYQERHERCLGVLEKVKAEGLKFHRHYSPCMETSDHCCEFMKAFENLKFE